MVIYTIFVAIAIAARFCFGEHHATEVITFVKRHSNAMTKEIEQRLNQGSKRSIAAHRNKKNAFAWFPSTEPTAQPTFAPSRKPSATPSSPPFKNIPTIFPTAQPTEDPALSSTGYFYLTNSFSSDCSNPVVSAGYPVNTCLADDTSSYKFRIVDDDLANAYIDYYGDSQCQQLIEGGVEITQTEVECQETESGVVVDPKNPTGKVYSQLFITTASTPPRLGDAGGGLIEHFEGSTTCDSQSFQSYLLYAPNVCLSSNGDSGAFYVQCTTGAGEVIIVFDRDSVPNCAGSLVPVLFPAGVCDGGISGDDDDAWYIDDYTMGRNKDKHKATTQTTKKGRDINPSPRVSDIPFPSSNQSTEVSQRLTCQANLAPTTAFAFKVTKQVINDFSKAVYDLDTELYGLTLKQTIASTMADVLPSGITDLTVSDTAARTSVRVIRRALQATSVTLTYTVSGASRYSASQLAGQLQAALVSGAFDTALNQLAVQNGALGLLNASSNNMETDIDEGSDDPVLTTGAIIGIAIGGAAFLVIVGVLIWYFCRAKDVTVRTTSVVDL